MRTRYSLATLFSLVLLTAIAAALVRREVEGHLVLLPSHSGRLIPGCSPDSLNVRIRSPEMAAYMEDEFDQQRIVNLAMSAFQVKHPNVGFSPSGMRVSERLRTTTTFVIHGKDEECIVDSAIYTFDRWAVRKLDLTTFTYVTDEEDPRATHRNELIDYALRDGFRTFIRERKASR